MKLTVDPGSAYAVIRPEGRITATNAAVLRYAVDDLVQQGHARIVLDLDAVEFIDSSGLGALVGAHKAVQQSGGDLRLVAAPNQVRMVLRLTNLDQVLPNHASAEEAFDVD